MRAHHPPHPPVHSVQAGGVRVHGPTLPLGQARQLIVDDGEQGGVGGATNGRGRGIHGNGSRAWRTGPAGTDPSARNVWTDASPCQRSCRGRQPSPARRCLDGLASTSAIAVFLGVPRSRRPCHAASHRRATPDRSRASRADRTVDDRAVGGGTSATFAQDDLAALLEQNRHGLRLAEDGTLAGEGARLLLERGRDARFVLIGEMHGVAEVPQFSAALFRALATHGLRHLAIETGEGVAMHLNRLAASSEPETAMARFLEDYWPGVPFYNLREEAALLVDAVAAAGGGTDVLWGLDYDIMADRYALRRLRELAADPVAAAAADALIATTDSLLAAALEQGNPGMLFMFSGDAGLVADVRRVYEPAPGSEADRILALMDETLAINQLFARDGYASNLRRAEHLKRQFHHFHAAAAAAGESPRVMVKLGANHIVRGRNFTNTWDVGTLAHELAEAAGERALGLYLMGGGGRPQATMDPRTLDVRSVEVPPEPWMEPLHAAALDDGWTLLEMAPLRAAIARRQLRGLPDDLVRVIFGFDAVVVLSGSTAASPLVQR
jgi:hypothetical protein